MIPDVGPCKPGGGEPERRETPSTAQASTQATIRWLSRAAEVGVFCLSLLGCSSVAEKPADPAEDRKSPPAAMAVAASPEQETPFDEFKKLLLERKGKLVLAGGASLIVLAIVGIGVGRILRGTTPAAEPRTEDRDGMERAEFERRS